MRTTVACQTPQNRMRMLVRGILNRLQVNRPLRLTGGSVVLVVPHPVVLHPHQRVSHGLVADILVLSILRLTKLFTFSELSDLDDHLHQPANDGVEETVGDARLEVVRVLKVLEVDLLQSLRTPDRSEERR